MQNYCIGKITEMHTIMSSHIKGRLDQPDFTEYFQVQSMLSKSKKPLLYQEKYNTVGEIYRDCFMLLA